MELLLIYLIVTILVIHSGNATLMISVGTDPIMPGNDVKLTCISSGSVATFVWQHNGGLIALGTIIQNPARFMIANMDKQSDLTIIGFENDLDGTWECHNFGIESTSISLSVDEASCLQTEGEPCDTELELTDWHRSIRYVTQSGDVLITDYFFNDGWYKLMTEGQRTDITMPTTSPAEFECGTQYPVWINGTYPEMDGKTNVVKGCVNIPDEPCKYELELCIKACGSDEERYYVHYLVDTPGSNMGYCTDSLLPCSNGTSSVTGFPPCAGNFPVLEGEPVLAFVKEPTGVSAYCDYRMLWSGEEEIDFFVRWFIDGEYVTDGPDLSKISDEFDCGTGLPYQCILNRKAGSNIECEVSSKFKDQDAYSQGIKSKLLYAGLIVLPNNTIVFVGESEDGETFELTSTIPIVCREENSVCVPRISINVDLNGETDAVADACSRSVEYQSPASFKIMAARDGYNDGDVANYIRFEADVTSLIPFSRIWEDLSTNLPTIQVVTKDVEIAKICVGSADPHYTTFDGWYYHIYTPGDYIFYQHRTLPIKIQSRVASCKSVACNCGVAVQVGHTHLIVDRCNDAGNYYVTYKTTHDGQIQKEIRTPKNTRVTTAEILRNGEKTPGTVLKYENGKFKIYLPTGSVLTIKLFWSHFLSLYLSASSDDFNNIDGLCGNFDKDPSNDGQYGPAGATTYDCSQPEDCEPAIHNSVPSKNFYESWRVADEENIFLGVLNVDKEFTIKRYCTCDEDIIKCDYCNARTDNDPILNCDDNNRRRREIVEEDPDDLVGTYEFTQSENDKDFEPYVPGFPTASGLTEEYTKQLCNETLMNSTTYNLCLNAINNGSVTVDDIIEGCIVDVKVSDDVSLARQTISDLQLRCEVVLTKNPMYWEESDNGTMVPPTALLGQLCVNECNDKGECVNGTCECNEGLGGSDCSISLAEPPLVFSVLGDGICDVRTRPCKSAKIYGENFVETGNVTCHIQNINVSADGITVLPTISTVAGIFRTPQEVKCPLPEPAVQPSLPGEGIVSSGYLISISNDGELKSEDMVIMIVYDSVCQVCNASEGECNMKNNSCNINGHCYAAFDVNMNDCCQQCLPEISIDSWSVRQEDMAPTVLTSNPYPAIHQEQLNFTFDIKDHEQCSITFSMISAFENATISQDGKFNWLPSVSSANQESMFNITMHDKCGFSAIVLFAVNICKCENSEVCAFVNGSSLYDCVCPEQLDDVSCGKEISTNYTQGTDSTVNPTTVIQISSFSQDQDDSTTDIFDVSDTSSSGSTTTNSGNSNVGNLSPKSSTSNSGTDNLNTSPPTDSFTVLERTSTVTTNKTSTTYVEGTDSTVNSITVPQISSFPENQDDSTTDIFDFADRSPSVSTSANYGNSDIADPSPKPSTSNSGTDNLKTSPLTNAVTIHERTSSTVNTNKTSTTYVEGTDSTVNSITVPQISSFPENQDDSTTDIFDFADRSTSANYGNSDIADPSQKPSTSNSGTDNLKTSPLTNTVTIHERTSMVNTNKTSTTYTQGTNATVNPITVPRISSFSQDQDDSKTGFDFTDATPSVSTSANYQNSNVGNSSPKPSTLNSGTDNFKTSPLAFTFTVHERTSTVNTNMTPLKTTIPDNYGTTAIRNHETIGISSAQVNPSPTHYIKGTSRSQGNTMHTAPQTNSDLEDLNNTTEPVSVKKTEVGSTILNTTPMKTTIPDGHGSTATRHEGTSERASAQVSSTSNSPTAPQASTGLIDLNNTTKTATVTKKEVDSTILNEQTMNYQEAIKLTLQGREEQWISAKQAFRASVSKAVNSFCYSNARKCCSVTDFNEQDTLDGDVTTSENVNLNERISESQIVIVLSIKHNNYIETCFQNNDDDRARRDVINHQYNNVFRQRRNTNEYISADVVKSSIEQGKTNIETEILMDIVDVSLYNTEESEEGGKYPKSYTMFIVVGACCFAVIGLLVFGVCFYKIHKNKSMETLIQVIPSRPTSVSDNKEPLKTISSGSLNGLFIAPSSAGSRAGSPASSVKAWDNN